MIAAPHAAARPAARRSIDWRQAAELLARGLTIATVARQLGCSRSQLSRKRNHDPVFQGWMEERQQRRAEPREDRMLGLRRVLQEAIESEVKNGNVRVILWLADRLQLVSPPGERTPEQELRALLGGLSADELNEFERLRDAP